MTLTESVPANEVRPAAGLNSITESTLRLVVNALGSLLLALAGPSVAFLLNAFSYLAASLSLYGMPSFSREQFTVGANPSGLSSDEPERDAAVRPEGFAPRLAASPWRRSRAIYWVASAI